MSHHTPHLVSHVRHPDRSAAAPVAQRIETKSAPDADIALRAYEKYEARGKIHGFDEEDWSTASRELIAETVGHPSSPSLSPSERAS